MGSYQYKGNNKDSVYFEQQSLDGLVKRVVIVQPESDQLPQKEWENINNVVMYLAYWEC